MYYISINMNGVRMMRFFLDAAALAASCSPVKAKKAASSARGAKAKAASSAARGGKEKGGDKTIGGCQRKGRGGKKKRKT
jgi:hypothetical protein